MNKIKLFFLTCLYLWGLSAYAQDTDFWFVAPDVTHMHGDQPMFFVLSNPEVEPVEVKVDLYGGAPAGSIAKTIDTVIPAQSYLRLVFGTVSNSSLGDSLGPKTLIENPVGTYVNYILTGTVQNYGIHIYSTNGLKFLAYYMVMHDAQRDIFSLKGKVALGTYFITPFQEGNNISDHFIHHNSVYHQPSGSDQIDIVATEDQTTVKFIPTRNCNRTANNQSYVAGTMNQVILNKGETFKLRKYTQIYVGNEGVPVDNGYENRGTLSGTVIHSDKPIAVTIAEDCIAAPGKSGTDLAGDQIVPVEAASTRFVVIKGRSTVGERIDFVATQPGTKITVYYKNGLTDTNPTPLNVGETWHTLIDKYSPSQNDSTVYVQSNYPVLCYQHSAINDEIGGGLIPSMYSISQYQMSFYVSDGTTNEIFLVFQSGCSADFTFDFFDGDGNPVSLTSPSVSEGNIPFPPELTGPGANWKYARVSLPSGAAGTMATVKNSRSPFSLGYLNGGTSSGTASYGYISGFGSSSFQLDTVWRCRRCTTCPPIKLATPVTMALSWTWFYGEGEGTPVKGPMTQNDTLFITPDDPAGMYHYLADKDGTMERDTCWILDMTFDTSFDVTLSRLPKKPAKVTVPQIFNVACGPGRTLPPDLFFQWDVGEGGEVLPGADQNQATVIWHTPGFKQLKLYLSATTDKGVPINWLLNKPESSDLACDTTLVYCVQVHEKNLGFFVDRDVPEESAHNGRSWGTAFPTIQQALALASQGDYIWVAEGTYSPRDGFPGHTNYAQVYAGDYMCDYDSLTVYIPSYVMDWDSVQVFGGFAGTERNLSERNILEHPTVLRGDGRSVIVMDGGTQYTNGLWGLTRGARWDGFTIREGVATQGGGVWFRNGAAGLFANDVIKRNEASDAGGGVYVDGPYTGPVPDDEPAFFQVEISGNRAVNGGGIYNNGSNLTLANVTVAGNYASRAGGGLYNEAGHPQILNTIIWDNTSGNGRDNDVANAGGAPYYSHSNIGGAITDQVWNAAYGTDGGQNLSVNPYFISTGDSDWPEGNYRLQHPSRVVEGGRNRYVFFGEPLSIILSSPDSRNTAYNGGAIAYDLANATRVIYNYVDMGAYEYVYTPINGIIFRLVIIPEVEGILTEPAAGIHFVESHHDFTIAIFPQEGYTLSEMRILSGSTLIDDDGRMNITRNENGSVTLVFREVNEPLTNISLTGIARMTSGNEVVDPGYRLWADRHQLHVQAAQPAELNIYTVAGHLYKRQEIAAGKTEILLPQGLYIVTLNNVIRQKITIR
jgi:hypothetical protein